VGRRRGGLNWEAVHFPQRRGDAEISAEKQKHGRTPW
jgi:hypothetical protein